MNRGAIVVGCVLLLTAIYGQYIWKELPPKTEIVEVSEEGHSTTTTVGPLPTRRSETFLLGLLTSGITLVVLGLLYDRIKKVTLPGGIVIELMKMGKRMENLEIAIDSLDSSQRSKEEARNELAKLQADYARVFEHLRVQAQ